MFYDSAKEIKTKGEREERLVRKTDDTIHSLTFGLDVISCDFFTFPRLKIGGGLLESVDFFFGDTYTEGTAISLLESVCIAYAEILYSNINKSYSKPVVCRKQKTNLLFFSYYFFINSPPILV